MTELLPKNIVAGAQGEREREHEANRSNALPYDEGMRSVYWWTSVGWGISGRHAAEPFLNYDGGCYPQGAMLDKKCARLCAQAGLSRIGTY
jgi:hypothetical protein